MIKEILHGAALGIIFLCTLYLIGRVLTAACIDGVMKHFKNKQSDIKKSFETKLKEKENGKEKKK